MTLIEHRTQSALAIHDPVMLIDQIKLQAPMYDHVVIDVGARDSAAMRAAMSIADVIMLPFTPSAYSIWGAEDAIELLKEAQAARTSDGKARLRIVPFLNKAVAAKEADSLQAIAIVEGYGFPVSPLRIGLRTSLERASPAGLNVDEFKPSDPKAREEVRQMVLLMRKISDSLRSQQDVPA